MRLTLDSDHLDNRLEYGSLEVGTGWETNANDCTASSYVLSSLLEWLLVDSDEDDCVGTKTIGSSLLYIGNKVLGCCEVNKGLGAKLLGNHLLLLVTSIDTKDTAAHCLCILASERSETTTGTNNSHPLTGLDARLLQALVNSDSGAENRSDGSKIALLGNAGNVSGLSNAVFLEGTVNCIAGKEGL